MKLRAPQLVSGKLLCCNSRLWVKWRWIYKGR